jgi:Uma2 family endonuclease
VSLPAPRHQYSFAQYLELEEESGVRHEYYAGEIYAMAGGTPEHAAIAAAVTLALGRQLVGKNCRVYSSDLRVRIPATGLATYPDVSVICGPSERDPASPTHVVNPTLVVEVLSPSTETYDRTDKLLHYQQLASLAAVVLVEPTGDLVTLWQRNGTEFHSTSFGLGETLSIDAIGCTLNVDELHAAARHA